MKEKERYYIYIYIWHSKDNVFNPALCSIVDHVCMVLTFQFAIFCRYLPGPDDLVVLKIAYEIYIKFTEYASALQIALFLNDLQVCLFDFIDLSNLMYE
jgi:hypothetical protein